MEKFLLSVVIPTRNRAIYAEQSIRQVLAQLSDDCQIVIQDNSDQPTLREQIGDLLMRDNITYHYSDSPLSFVDNFDQALSLVEGRYVCMIGDDDGVTSFLRPAALWAEQQGIQAIRPSLDLVYFWPDSKVYSPDKDNGNLRITSSNTYIWTIDTKKSLKRLLNDGGLDYLDKEMVKIYHGLVSYDLLKQIKDKTGKFVGGLSPDIYLSMALTLLADRPCVTLGIPLTISGICSSSGSSSSATGAHTGKLEDAPHFNGHENYQWDERVPRLYSVETIWADSALAAVKDLEPTLLSGYQSFPLRYRLSRLYPQFSAVIPVEQGDGVRRFFYSFERIGNRVMKSIRYRLARKKVLQFSEIESIHQASELIESHLQAVYKEFEDKHIED